VPAKVNHLQTIPNKTKSKTSRGLSIKVLKLQKNQLKIPIILVGGFLSYPLAEAVVTSGDADYVALARPLIREPRLVKRWAAGDLEKASCISCNCCFLTLATEEALHCAQNKKEKNKSKRGEHSLIVANYLCFGRIIVSTPFL